MSDINMISDLHNNANDIACEPAFIFKNGVGDFMTMGTEQNDCRQLLLLYDSLAEAEAEIASGDQGEDFFEFAESLRNCIHGNQYN